MEKSMFYDKIYFTVFPRRQTTSLARSEKFISFVKTGWIKWPHNTTVSKKLDLREPFPNTYHFLNRKMDFIATFETTTTVIKFTWTHSLSALLFFVVNIITRFILGLALDKYEI